MSNAPYFHDYIHGNFAHQYDVVPTSLSVNSFSEFGVRYTIEFLEDRSMTCTCPSFKFHGGECKHIKHVKRYVPKLYQDAIYDKNFPPKPRDIKVNITQVETDPVLVELDKQIAVIEERIMADSNKRDVLKKLRREYAATK